MKIFPVCLYFSSTNECFYLYVLSKEVEFEQNRFEKQLKIRDSLNSVSAKLNDANYFSLEKNENAQNYFESAGGQK
jgi:hypothetical protein